MSCLPLACQWEEDDLDTLRQWRKHCQQSHDDLIGLQKKWAALKLFDMAKDAKEHAKHYMREVRACNIIFDNCGENAKVGRLRKIPDELFAQVSLLNPDALRMCLVAVK